MSKKRSDSSTVIMCERFTKHLRASQRAQGDKILNRPNLKKIVFSQQISTETKDKKSSSTGVIFSTKSKARTFKTTKSDCFMNESPSKLDFCKKCGDSEDQVNSKLGNSSDPCNLASLKRIIHSKKPKQDGIIGLQQHYINKNFKPSTESLPDSTPNKVSLDTIKEQPESVNSEDGIFRIYDDCSTEEIGFFNTDDKDNIKNIKNFRSTNFFECHSAKSRLSIANNEKHHCIYRFYLNERLFPVPFNADFNENIRCMECNLPVQDEKDLSRNGLIQAKVNLNNQVQDMLLMLPVKKHLIIKERKKTNSKKDLDSVYFGIIKLDLNGDSIFNRTLPEDSLALKYQKGYRQFTDKPSYDYSTKNDDIVII